MLTTMTTTPDFPDLILSVLDAAGEPLAWNELLFDAGYLYQPYGWQAAMVRLIQRGEIRRDVDGQGHLVFARRRRTC